MEPLVSLLVADLEKMKVDFVLGYRASAAVFYVSTQNFEGYEQVVEDADWLSWSPHWRQRDCEFEHVIRMDLVLHVLSNKFFLYGMVTIGN